jgi:DNA-binding MarR family transcriptional regulator
LAAVSDVERAMAALARVEAAVRPAIFADLMELDLTMGQLRALVHLERSGPLTISRFAEVLGTRLPGASVFADRLERTGLVRRREDEADRRRVVLELTPRGHELAGRLRGKREQVMEAIARLSPDDVRALAQGMDALAREMELGRPGDPKPMREVPNT